MSDTEASTPSQTPAFADESNAARPAADIDRTQATRLMMEARRLHGIAELIQARHGGGIDSSVLAYRSLSLLLGLLLRLRGDPIPDGFAGLVERARAIAAAERLLAEDLGVELTLIHEMRERFVSGGETTPAEDRRYDRAFLRSAEWFGAVQAYLDQRLPRPVSRIRRHLPAVLAVLLAFVVGLAVGRHGGATWRGLTVEPSPLPVDGNAMTVPVLSANFSCLGCFSVEKGASGPFVWTTRDPTLMIRGLEPGARYLIALRVVDSGVASRITLETPDGLIDELPLHPGTVAWPSSLSAGRDGAIHWSVRVAPFRLRDRLPGATDVRLLGVAISGVDVALDIPR